MNWRRRVDRIAWGLGSVAVLLFGLVVASRWGPIGYRWGDESTGVSHWVHVWVGSLEYRQIWGSRPIMLRSGEASRLATLRSWRWGPYYDQLRQTERQFEPGVSYHNERLRGVHLGAFVLAAGLFPTVWLLGNLDRVVAWQAARLRARRLRSERPRCARCGYDLRASPERCPECGEVRAEGGRSSLD